MSTETATAYWSNFTGRIAFARIRKSPEIKPFHGHRSTCSGKAHCIKDRVLLDETCGSGGLLVGAKNNSEVMWSEQRSI